MLRARAHLKLTRTPPRLRTVLVLFGGHAQVGVYLVSRDCILYLVGHAQVGVYLALGADVTRVDVRALCWLAVIVALPQIYGLWRRKWDRSRPAAE